MPVVKGPFDVKLTPQSSTGAEETTIGRLLIAKAFHGDLEATSAGQMLAFRSAVEGSAGYVAMEHVRGTLLGKSGGFVLQHSGTMSRGASGLDLTVVPDSGSGELLGLSGSMKIEIADGKHSYEFDFQL